MRRAMREGRGSRPCGDNFVQGTLEASLPDALWCRALRRAELPTRRRRPTGQVLLDVAVALIRGERVAKVAGRRVLADVERAIVIHTGDVLDRAILEARI